MHLTSVSSHLWLEFVDVSQQLCDRLKQLLLTCESFDLLSLADSDPLGYTGPSAQLFSFTSPLVLTLLSAFPAFLTSPLVRVTFEG